MHPSADHGYDVLPPGSSVCLSVDSHRQNKHGGPNLVRLVGTYFMRRQILPAWALNGKPMTQTHTKWKHH